MDSIDERLDKIILSIEKMQQDRKQREQEREQREKQREQEREQREQEREKAYKQWEQKLEQQQKQWEHQRAVNTAEYIQKIEGKYGYEIGSITEKIYFANLEALYRNRDWELGEIFTNFLIIGDNVNQQTEVDVLSINPDFIIATEVKLTLTCKKVDTYVSKLPIIKQHLVRNGFKQRLFGAVACIKNYLVKEDGASELKPHSSISALDYAEQKYGLFTVEIFGHTARFSGKTGEDKFKPKVYTV